jgi:hypothetical protein
VSGGFVLTVERWGRVIGAEYEPAALISDPVIFEERRVLSLPTAFTIALTTESFHSMP